MADAVLAAFNLVALFLALMLARAGFADRAAAAQTGAATNEPSDEQRFFKRKGQARFAILFGMIIIQVVLMPVYGGDTGTLVALLLAAVTFFILHKRYGY